MARHGARAVSAALVLAVVGCSLGLDHSLADHPDGGGADASPSLDANVNDAGPDAVPEPEDAAATCTKDTDCAPSPNGCLTPHCDLPRQACVYTSCRDVCKSGTCDTTAKTCGTLKPYLFRAASFPVGAGVGCATPQRCFAVVYPYVFVGTPTGVVAFAASDPATTAPTPVAVFGVEFVPTQIIASDSRVFFLGAATGTATAARVQLAALDVPSDPFSKGLVATSALVSVSRPSADPYALGARTGSTALLIDATSAQSYPTGILTPPLVDQQTVATNPITFNATSPSILATAGTRLVMQGGGPTSGTFAFSLVSGAGTATTAVTPDVTTPPAAGFFSAPQFFGTSPDGAVGWMIASLTGQPGGAQPATVRASRFFFLLGSDPAAPIDFSAGVDVEVYTPGTIGVGAAVAGPIAMIDPATAMVTSASAQNIAQTSVQFATKAPAALVTNADKSPRRIVLPVPPQQVAASASNGLGYVLTSDSPTGSTVYVFDPGCASQ